MNRKLLLDSVERTGWTAIQAGAAALIVSGFTLTGLAIAGTAAGLTILKCITSSQVGDSNSAASLPASLTVEQNPGGI